MSATTSPPPAPKLAIELIPRSAWYSNLRKFLTQDQWREVTKIALEKAGHRCEACGSRGSFAGTRRLWLETHETWDFDTATGVQTLLRNRALCTDCHESVHMGLADVRGRGEGARKHLERVNGWTPDQAAQHEAAAWRRWREQNRIEAWVIDIRVLHGIDIGCYEAAMAYLRALLRS